MHRKRDCGNEGKKNCLQLFRTAALKGGLKREGLDEIMNYLNMGIMVHACRRCLSGKTFTVLHSFVHTRMKRELDKEVYKLCVISHLLCTPWPVAARKVCGDGVSDTVRPLPWRYADPVSVCLGVL